MSSNPVVRAESISLLAVKETTLGVAPAAGGQTLQPNPDGVSDYYLHTTVVQRAPLSRLRQMEASEIVDGDATPKLTHDLTKDLTDTFGEGIMLARAKHNGGTGTAYFTNNLATPTVTARTTTAYTVSANGALQAGTLVVPRGWVTGANATANGTLQVVGASSTGTSVPVAAGVAETPSGYTVTLEVAGFRGASGDIGLDVSGNLTSTVADFTTMGLVAGQVVWLGGTVGGGHDFIGVPAYRGYAKILTIAQHLLTFSWRQWTVAAADPGTGQAIDLYWGRWIRNVAFGAADYVESTYQLELTYPGLSGGVTDEYAYSFGNMLDQFMLTMGKAALVTTELSFIGTTIGDPTVTRQAWGTAAGSPLAVAGVTTVTKLLYERLTVQATNAIVSDDIDTSKLTFMNHVSPQKQHGNLGTKRDVVGKVEVGIDMTAFLTQDDALKACRANTTLTYGVGLRNEDGGWFFDVPDVKCTDSTPKFPANGPVTLDLKLAAFRDPTSNFTLGMTLFPYLPIL
jgi:hypothetical protein